MLVVYDVEYFTENVAAIDSKAAERNSFRVQHCGIAKATHMERRATSFR